MRQNVAMALTELALRHPVRRFARHEVDFRRRILTMAVVNRTPDSFLSLIHI